MIDLQKLYTQIQEEFDAIDSTYPIREEEILSDDTLITIQSKYNLFEIQPYYAQLENKVLSPDTKLMIDSDDDYNPETDDLYDYKINLQDRRTYLKKQYFSIDVFYGTIFEYTEHFHKSFTVYQNNGDRKIIHLSYLYLKDGLPDQYIECTEYGISLKTYTCSNDRIKSYKLEWPTYNHHCIGELDYDANGQVTQIKETASDGRMRILFDAATLTKDIESVLSELENFLVENISDQILNNVKIEEPVYCILFEYTMQGPFPPTIAFGTVSEIDGKFEEKELYELYNAPDMKYFSENDMSIEFYQEEIQPNYLIADAHGDNIPWENEEASSNWEAMVMETYLRVCKRLMHFNFSSSFTKSENFLVMARDFEQCNEEIFYKKLSAYKKEKGF